MHLTNEPSVDVNRRQIVGVALIEVKQFSDPDVQENLGNGSLLGVSYQSVARLIYKPAGEWAGKPHDNILWLMKQRRDEEEENEEMNFLYLRLQVCDDIDDRQGTQIDPEYCRDRQVGSRANKFCLIGRFSKEH